MIKLGLIGTGVQGKRFIKALEKTNDAKIVVVSNTRKTFPNFICKEWQDVIASDIDGVIVATDPQLNLNIVKQANFRNLPVLLEKPAALSLLDIQKMEKLKIPIMINYVHLFSPVYEKLKEEVKDKKIKHIVAAFCNKGPNRSFSSLYDYAPHPLSMALDLCNGEAKLITKSVYKGKLGGNIFSFEFLVNDTKVLIKVGNGGTEKQRRFLVLTDDGAFKYDNDPDYEAPLNNAVSHFLNIIKEKEKPLSFDLTTNIHKILYKLGVQ